MRKVPEIDGLRGIAILAVFFHHACYASLGSVVAAGWSPAIQTLERAAKYGDTGVDLFFVVSGFLITSILLLDRNSRTYYRDFYWRRLLRIGPVLFAALAVTVILGEYRFALVSLLFLANFGYQLHAAGTAPFWSLAIEEQFYLIWPTAVREIKISVLRHLSIAIIVVTVILRYCFAFNGHNNYHLTFLRIDTLAMGSLIAILLPEPTRQPVLSAKLGATFSCGILCLASSATCGNWATLASRELGVGLVCASIVAVSVFFTGHRLLGLLRWRLLAFFAQTSYAFYLFHSFVFHIYDRYFGIPTVGNEQKYWIRLMALMLGSLAVACLSRWAIELPALRLRSRLPRRRHITN